MSCAQLWQFAIIVFGHCCKLLTKARNCWDLLKNRWYWGKNFDFCPGRSLNGTWIVFFLFYTYETRNEYKWSTCFQIPTGVRIWDALSKILYMFMWEDKVIVSSPQALISKEIRLFVLSLLRAFHKAKLTMLKSKQLWNGCHSSLFTMTYAQSFAWCL